MRATYNEPFDELAVDPWTLPNYCLSNQVLTPPVGSLFLQEFRRGGKVRGRGAERKHRLMQWVIKGERIGEGVIMYGSEEKEERQHLVRRLRNIFPHILYSLDA